MSQETIERLNVYYSKWQNTTTLLNFWQWLMYELHGTSTFDVNRFGCSTDEIDILLARYAFRRSAL